VSLRIDRHETFVASLADGDTSGVDAFVEAMREGDHAHIVAFYTRPGARGQGIGSALLDRVDAALAYAGVADVVVGAFAANAGALALYERRGFRPTWNYLSRFAGREGA
jgi:ribosomal protein S18 acetylase RimI-like enzyme